VDGVRVLLVHHTPSPAMQELLEEARRGVHEVEGVELVVRPALACGAAEVLEADGYLLGTPANIGYMSGALKHFFDQIYYPCLDATVGRPYGLYVHGGSDTEGAVRSIDRIVGALRWTAVRPPLTVVGAVGKQEREDCWELGGLVAASVAGLV
jgi:NAD(P)H-dependent FMN reductase